jgi:glycosyltransferase involved in cell wall biosynthesis
VDENVHVKLVGGAEREGEAALRVVMLCGSIKPLFSGTDDFNDTLMATLRAKQIDARSVDSKRWGVGAVSGLLRQVGAERPDAILMQYPTDAFGAALGPHVFGALQRQAPLIVTLHEFVAANPLRRASLGLLLARCAAVVPTAETERQALLGWFPWLKTRAMTIPIAANFVGRNWRPSTPPVVAYFGQIRPEKGLEDYIACQGELAARFPDARFVIAGSRVPKFAAFHQSIEAAARERGIALLGELAADQVPDLLRTATVALLPYPSGASFRRGSLLAAAACGVPIVTTLGAETPAEMTALLLPAASRETMVSRVAEYLSDVTSRDAAHERSRRLSDMVSWDSIGDRYVELISRIAARRSGA